MTAKLTIVGLGSGDENQLSLGIWRQLQAAQRIYIRTANHPVISWLRQENIEFISFDDIYEQYDEFAPVYERISEELIQACLQGDGEVLYAVPGHPRVAEATVRLLQERCPERGIELNILGGESFLDQAFLRLGFDPIEGFQLLDGGVLDRSLLQPQLHTLITQVYDRLVASDVKLSLMEVYPDDYPVVVAHALGVAGLETMHTIPLYELDRRDDYGNLSLIWIPKSNEEALRNRSFDRLREIMSILRSPEGCPWDREQTHQSIRKNLIEEAYEVLETIDDDDPVGMCEELGDLMLQVVFHAQLEEEAGTFTVYDVIEGINEKLLRRHPHVFGEREASNAEEALESWQDMKAEEKRKKGIDPEQLSILSGVPRDLPAVSKALKLQKKASAVGFDWYRVDLVMDKIHEELSELAQEIEQAGESREDRLREELGDVMFSIVNLARFLKVDPEDALSACNRKFTLRFQFIENELRKQGRSVEDANLDELEMLWEQAKFEVI